MKFSNTKLIEASFLDLDPVEVMTLSCDPCGSHVIEAFFESTAIRGKPKEEMLNKMSVRKVENTMHKIFTCTPMLK